jgi:hypothetical protein
MWFSVQGGANDFGDWRVGSGGPGLGGAGERDHTRRHSSANMMSPINYETASVQPDAA